LPGRCVIRISRVFSGIGSRREVIRLQFPIVDLKVTGSSPVSHPSRECRMTREKSKPQI
jgi:hypothetical protein